MKMQFEPPSLPASPSCRLAVAIPPAALLHFANFGLRHGGAEENCDSRCREVSTCHENTQAYEPARRSSPRSPRPLRPARAPWSRCPIHRRRPALRPRTVLPLFTSNMARNAPADGMASPDGMAAGPDGMAWPARMEWRSPRTAELAFAMGRRLVRRMVPALLGAKRVGQPQLDLRLRQTIMGTTPHQAPAVRADVGNQPRTTLL